MARRIGELRAALLRLAWNEAERPEAERLEVDVPETDVELFAFYCEEIEALFAEACLTPGFGEEPLDD